MKRILFALLACLPLTGQAAIQYFMGSPGQVFMVGLSSDTKPAAGNASVNGAVFLESDTDKVFRRVAGAWVEQDNTAYQNASAELDNLTSNCVVGNDSTPVPDSCVGDGTDDVGAGGGVDTANSPNANEFARFTDADTIEGRTAAEAKADLDLEIGTDLAPSNLDYLVGTASGNLSAEIAVGTTPGGELGNTWASPTLDDSLTVDAWAVTNATGTTAGANDNDTSLATTAFVQQEVDDVDLLSDNCVLENDATPVPDSCVGNGSDADTDTTNFNADGDNNSPQTINATDELLIAGGTNGVDTVASATDTVTINLDLSESAAGGELGGNLDAPTLDDSVTVTGWVMGASTATSPAGDDNDTSLATSAFVQSEIDDADNLSDNCAVEADSTPVPDSCVGNGADDGAATNIDYLVGTATGGLSAEIVAGTAPGGELGGTWASPTLDDTVTVDAWVMGASTATSPAGNDNDTSLATSAFVQSEIDDGDNLTDNCALEADATPIPDSCVGDGSDAGGSYSFNADGDNNSPQTITDTNELLIAGGTNGIDTSAAATDTVTINLDLSESAAGGELGGNLDAPTIDDSVSVTGWTIDEINLDAGSASAGSWPNFTSGTVLTTAEDGALELDADALYFTTDAGNRGNVPIQHVIRAASAQTLTSAGTAQQIFDSPANGRLAIETGTYIFELHLRVSGMSGTSGNAALTMLCSGTCGDYNWKATGIDGAPGTIVAHLTSWHNTNTTAASVVTATTNTNLVVDASGTFECSVAGNFTPQITLVTAAAATIEAGSYFIIRRIGAASAASIGQWD